MFLGKEDFKKRFKDEHQKRFEKNLLESTLQEQYETLGAIIGQQIRKSLIETKNHYKSAGQKQVFYFSIEFLLGRLLKSNLLNLGILELVDEGLKELEIDFEKLEDNEPDAGLGNGGLGRLAACFLDSLASLGLPGHGVGIRYKKGFFTQKIIDGYQKELPEKWLENGNPWEIEKPDEAVEVKFGGEVKTALIDGKLSFSHLNPETVAAVPYDVPIVGYKNNVINSLRLWSTETDDIADFLYPDDTHLKGRILRLKQQYFLISAGLQSIVRDYLRQGNNIADFHTKVAIHVNDTHPVLAIPELMRILIDQQGLSWEEAWEITTNTISFTNHTTLSEALEKWSIDIFQPLLPRIYMIVKEINERFCGELWRQYPGDWNRIAKMAIIADGEVKMAHLAIVGSHSVNGVAKLHSEILKQREMNLFYSYSPPKFNNKTNGITHRRWLVSANPNLASLISETIGSNWITNPQELCMLSAYADDISFQQKVDHVKQENKKTLAKIIFHQQGLVIDENSIFDVQIKRLHAYKRQLLNVLHIMYLYNRLKEDSDFSITPRTFIFGAKASHAYYYAKKIIKLINLVGHKVNNDKQIQESLKVVFLENYRVSLAEKIIPAANVSEQISTASKEASGTGNMKLMMNGALTLGTLDGANIEILEEVGKDNIFTFGLTAEEVIGYYKQGGYHSIDYYQKDGRINQVLSQLTNGFFPLPAEEFQEIYDSLLLHNDEYFVLKDFAHYVEAQENLENVYLDKNSWLKKSIINIAKSGRFSSDRTIQEYATEIWHI